MAKAYKSEIRDGAIRKLLQKVKDHDYGFYLKRIKLDKVRAFSNESIEFTFPVTAIIGTNGGGEVNYTGVCRDSISLKASGYLFS